MKIVKSPMLHVLRNGGSIPRSGLCSIGKISSKVETRRQTVHDCVGHFANAEVEWWKTCLDFRYANVIRILWEFKFSQLQKPQFREKDKQPRKGGT